MISRDHGRGKSGGALDPGGRPIAPGPRRCSLTSTLFRNRTVCVIISSKATRRAWRSARGAHPPANHVRPRPSSGKDRKPMTSWNARRYALGLAGLCLTWVGCGRSDVPDPDSDSHAATGSALAAGPGAARSAPKADAAEAPAEPEPAPPAPARRAAAADAADATSKPPA